MQTSRVHPTVQASVALLLLALLCTSLAYPRYFHLIASVGPTRTTTVTYLLPLFGTLWGALFLREPVTRGMMLDLTLILSSVLLVNDVPIKRIFTRRAHGSASALL